MKQRWFVRKGILFFPAAFTGWLIAAISLIYCVYRFIEIDAHSHSVSDTLRPFLITVFLVFAVYSAIGMLTGGKNKSA